jgi:rRNA-processing protein FCF1
MKQPEQLVAQYKNKGVLIDTNLLLLLVVGAYDPERISRFKRTDKFSADGFYILSAFFKSFDRVMTTPHILTEVSNLAGQLPDDIKTNFYSLFAEHLALLEEHYTPSAQLSSVTQFRKLGLTDCGILELSRNQYLVLTDDFRLAGHLDSQGIDVINFNHIRPINWG